MYAFTYERPAATADAAKLVKAGGQALAGGQTLLASMKQRLMQPEQLVDLGKIAELKGIKKDGNNIVIGAMVRHQEVENNADVKKHIPALAALASGIGDKQVRAMGTMGGSVANNDPAACYPSAVLALGATIHTNQRTIAADKFFQGMYATALEAGELITAISFPIPKRAAYAKFNQPASRFALTAVFVAKYADGVRVAVTGASNEGVFRWTEAEAALSANFSADAIAGLTVDASNMINDLHGTAAYRANLVKVLTGRAVSAA